MGGRIIGAEGRWDPFVEPGEPSITLYDLPGKDLLWRRSWDDSTLPDTAAQDFSVSLGAGILVQRKADFLFAEEPSLGFTRVYRNQDDRSRAFGIGGSDSFDMFLGGQMGVAVDLIMADGHRIHFIHRAPVAGQRGDTYRPEPGTGERFVEAVYAASSWWVTTTDGWTYYFPYTPNALPQYVTVLTSFIDPAQHKYEMKRDSFGSLLDITSASGNWLHFENDSEHRIRKIASSSGRSMQYDYDETGHMVRAADSEGHVDSYTYDEKGQMLTAAHGNEKAVLTNEYFVDGYIKSQMLVGGRKFKYFYFRDSQGMHENQIMDPNGLETYVQYETGGYTEGLPARPPYASTGNP